VEAAVGGIEKLGAVNHGDGLAVFAAEAFVKMLVVDAAGAGVVQGLGRDAEVAGHLGDLLGGGASGGGMAIAADGVGLNGHLVLDGRVGMGWMIEIKRVLGSDKPVGGGDAAVGGADGDAVGARGAGEGFEAAAGEAAMKFLRIGKDFIADTKP